MYCITSDSVHYYGKNELGEQISSASISIWSKANGISILSRVLSDAIRNSSIDEDGGMAISITDISNAVEALADFSNIVAMDISNLNEAITSNGASQKLNELDANKDVFRYEYNYRYNTRAEARKESDRLHKRTA